MKIEVEVDISPAEILNNMGLGTSNDAAIFVANEVKRLCEPYVPYQSGRLAHDAVIAPDGSELTYVGPYANYQYTGLVYGPNYFNGERFWSGKAPKVPTGKALKYNGAPMRGPNWDKRMMADKAEQLAQSLENFIAGRNGQ